MTPASPNGEPLNGQLPSARPEPATTAAASREPRTQSAKEALGASVGSGLFMASVQAGIAFALLLGALTLGPYYWEKSQANATPTPAPAEKGKAAPAANQVPVAPAPSSPDPNANGKGAPTVANGKQPKKGDIVDKLGENKTKTAPAKVNPLDKKEDDLLKDIK
jgi:hypothetical protein